MTQQIEDRFHLDGIDYTLIGATERQFFDPLVLGIDPVHAGTACWRGYLATFGIVDDRLVLKDLYANLIEESPLFPAHSSAPFQKGVGPLINGIAPKVTELAPYDEFNNYYADINYQLEYSGGMLLVHDPVLDGYLMMQYVWTYRMLYELVFDRGRLNATYDRSEQMAELRLSYRAIEHILCSSGETPPKEIRQLDLERCFFSKYTFGGRTYRIL